MKEKQLLYVFINSSEMKLEAKDAAEPVAAAVPQLQPLSYNHWRYWIVCI